jgi:hypothetical protein
MSKYTDINRQSVFKTAGGGSSSLAISTTPISGSTPGEVLIVGPSNELEESPIKTINGNSLLGSGDLVVSANPSVIALSATNGTAVTGTTNDTLSRSLLIPANTFTGDGILEILARFTKTGTAGTISTRAYINTSASLTGATLIATFNSASLAGTVYSQGIRTARINSNTLTVIGLSSTQSLNDYVSNANNIASTTFTTSVDNYLIFSVQLGNSGDTATCAMARAVKYI